jgi:glycosyltransferase involved in cell wall biosynthesis
VTCTDVGCRHLTSLAPAHRVELLYHGLDLAHLPPAPPVRAPRDGSDANDPVTILSVGRRVEKKGFDDVLQALALLPADLHWCFSHIGGGGLGDALKAQARRLGIADRCTWHGAQAQQFVFDAYADADLFVLASRIAEDGDRDGLPNVLMEAQSQALACVSTRVSAIPELIEDGSNGLLVPPSDPPALAKAIERLIRDPALRAQLAQRGHDIVRQRFSFEAGVERLLARLPR